MPNDLLAYYCSLFLNIFANLPTLPSSHNPTTAVIVMISCLEEGGKSKCHQYWPSPSPSGRPTVACYGNYEVSLLREMDADGFVLRKLEVQYENQRRVVVQLQMTSWPDHGVPGSASSFLALHSAYRATTDQAGASGPPVIHCSAGVGRSGTFFCKASTLLLAAILEATAAAGLAWTGLTFLAGA